MLRLSVLSSLLLSSAALADVPRVTTDILPVHGLASRVMEGVGTPDLLVDPGASPHGYALRPSQAAALQDADVVIWVSDRLSPWLEGPLDTLSADAVRLELLEVEGSTSHEFRERAVFDEHDDHDHDTHDEHDHDDHDEHDHDEHDDNDDHDHDDHEEHDGHEEHDEHDHDTHDHDEHGHEGHSHTGLDPHAWLDPENARVWLSAIAETLAELDPENADTYRANAEAGRAELAEVIADIEARLAPFSDQPYIVFHDAYQYFEARFGLQGAGAISLGDASQPSAARIAEIQDAMADRGVVCVFSEPQFNPGLVATVANGTEARTEVIDPLGQAFEQGAGFYPAFIDGIAQSFETCLSAE